MARKSRKVQSINNTAVYKSIIVNNEEQKESQIFRAGLYTRLSVEDEGAKERETIHNQMHYLERFVEDNDNIKIVKKYKDVDTTGTNFDRAGFKQMMEDIRNNVINCVIVKDLSRLGRNYVETSNYIERVFPFFDVRFIAINDDIDTCKREIDIMAPLMNIINEMYVKDISEKIKSTFNTKVINGECVHAKVPYGYKRDHNNKHKLLIDDIAAKNVKLIFEMAIQGKSYSEIARYMNDMNILTPSLYRKKRSNVNDSSNSIWKMPTVKYILSNGMYTGDLEWGINYHSKFDTKKGKKPFSERIIVKNNHDAIISREEFELAQQRLKKSKEEFENNQEKNKIKGSDNMFSGKIFCADCGKRLVISAPFENRSFACRGYVYKDRGYTCTRHTIFYNDVKKIVFAVIRDHIKSCLDCIDVINSLNKQVETIKEQSIYSKEIKRLDRERNRVISDKLELFEDYKQKLVDEEQYIEISNRYNLRIKKIENDLERLNFNNKKITHPYIIDRNLKALVNKYKNKRTLSKEMVDAFIDKILVSEDGKCQINLKYEDCFNDLKENIRERRNMII